MSIRFYSIVLAASLFLSLSAQKGRALTIDNFDGTAQLEVDPATPAAGVVVADPGAVGGRRSIEALLTEGPRELSVDLFGGVFSHSQASLVKGDTLVVWDGNDTLDEVDFDGLGGVDIAQDGSTAIKLKLLFSDSTPARPLDLTVRVYDASSPSGQAWSLGTITLDRPYDDEYLTIPFTSFNEGGADLSNVGAITLFVNGISLASDVTIDWIGGDNDCVAEDKDVCGVCFGAGDTCLDCAGEPFGPRVWDGEDPATCCLPEEFDDCGVCFGANECEEPEPLCSDSEPAGCRRVASEVSSEQVDQSFFSFRKFDIRLLRSLPRSRRKVRRTLRKEVKAAYSVVQTEVATLSTVVLECSNENCCVDSAVNQDEFVSLNAQVDELFRIARAGVKAFRTRYQEGECEGTLEECLKRVKARNRSFRRLMRQARAFRDELSMMLEGLPDKTSTCS